jgi:hypothetical protein
MGKTWDTSNLLPYRDLCQQVRLSPLSSSMHWGQGKVAFPQTAEKPLQESAEVGNG